MSTSVATIGTTRSTSRLKPIYYASPGETAMSANGDYAVVGAPGRNDGQGAAYVFARSGDKWAQEAMLTLAQPHPYEGFGWAVAMSSDGSTILASAPFHSSRGLTDNGGAWVFHRTGTQWTQLAELEPSDAAKFDAFGWSFAIAGEQAPYTVFVGAPSHMAAGVAQSGAVYVFSGSLASWTFRSELHAAKPVVNGGYGTGVALSQDAATGVVTTFDHTDPKKIHHQGAVAIYTTTDGWSHSTLAASFTDPNRNLDKTPDAYGTDAGISADGTTVMVAAPDVFVGGIGGAGALYVYARRLAVEAGNCRARRHAHPADSGRLRLLRFFGRCRSIRNERRRGRRRNRDRRPRRLVSHHPPSR